VKQEVSIHALAFIEFLPIFDSQRIFVYQRNERLMEPAATRITKTAMDTVTVNLDAR
jgi:hypothetical protein